MYKYKYMGNVSWEDVERCKTDTYTDYDGNLIALSEEKKKAFYNTVTRIKEAVGCDTEIINGDLEILEGENAALGTNIDNGRLIIIDNFYIDEALSYNCLERGLVETICHEIAHNKYPYHGRWHSALTAEYIDKVSECLEAEKSPNKGKKGRINKSYERD